VLELLERQRVDDLHDCAQVYVSLAGETLLDAAIGETRPGRALRTDDVMLWYSSGKPLTTVAVLQLWEQGRLGLDDRIAQYVDGWANGKEACTIRQVLIHTGGFPMYGSNDFDTDLDSAEVLARIAATPAAWEPGTKAGYHPVTGWKVLGAVVEAVDGRPIETYLRDEILAPLGASSSLGVSRERQLELGDALVPVAWKGHRFPVVEDDGGLRMVPYRIDKVHNEPWHVATGDGRRQLLIQRGGRHAASPHLRRLSGVKTGGEKKARGHDEGYSTLKHVTTLLCPADISDLVNHVERNHQRRDRSVQRPRFSRGGS